MLCSAFYIYAYTFTAHAHLHLAEQVRLHGPLQSHSQFCFEGALYNLKNLLHGTKGFINQISKQIFLYKNLKTSFYDTKFENNDLKDYIEKKLCINSNRLETRLLGKYERIIIDNYDKLLFLSLFKIDINYAVKSDRVYSKKRLFHSKSYSRKGNSNSYSISFIENSNVSFGDIEYFLEFDKIIYAVITKHCVKEFSTMPQSCGLFYDFSKKYFSRYFKLIEYSDIKHIINVNYIKNKCILIDNESSIFLTELEYEFEHD